MKRKIYLLALILLNCISTFAQNSGQTEQIILKLKTENKSLIQGIGEVKITGNNAIDQISQKFNASEAHKLSGGIKNKQYIYTIRFPKGTNIHQVIGEYEQTNEIVYAEPDFSGSADALKGIHPNDQYYYRQWGLKNNGSFSLSTAVSGADIDMENAWTIERGDSNIVVGIIDSGTKLNHPEFTGRIWTNYAEIATNGIDDDNNGYIDDVKGWDFVNDDNNPTDDEGHGTNVSGIIGANGNNGIGYAGIDWNCKLMILKGIDSSNQGFYSWWANALYYAVDNGADVINMSLGGSSTSLTLQDAVNYALSNQVVVVVSMGNSNANVIRYPAAYNGVIAVGSTDSDDNRSVPFFWNTSSGSNYGNHISVVAPGNFIYGLNYESNSNYSFYWGGTSQAAPAVCGLSALLLAHDPTLTPPEIKALIEWTAEDQVGSSSEDTPGWDQYYGHGRINAYNALSSIGIKALDAENRIFSVYPNPGKGEFKLDFPKETEQIQLFNSLGKLVQVIKNEGQTTADFQLYDNGIYFIQITIEGKTYPEKLVVCK